jgi:hypothetical protein
MRAHLVDSSSLAWEALDRLPDRTVFQRREWLSFISETQEATPVIAELREGSKVVGWFTGLTIRRFGVKILGSAFPGWTTPYMGFNLREGASLREALLAIEQLAFGELKCLHLEVWDRRLTVDDGRAAGFVSERFASFESDLRAPESELFARMSSACRRCVRKAEKSGVVIEEAHDLGFADEYHSQLVEVFAKHRLRPTYGVERVRSLIRHLDPGGHLLMLRARAPDGECIATGLYPAWNKIALFWGNASWSRRQSLRPNEALHWHAMRVWRGRGIERFDWGGGNDYKVKYGVEPLTVVRLSKSRFRLLSHLRTGAWKLFKLGQRLRA